jgi:alkylhydroperoxidase family enzyme
MSHISPRSPDEVAFLAPVLEATRRQIGFLPNSLLTMAHMPHVALAFGLLMSTIRGGDLKAAYAAIADNVPAADDPQLNVEPQLLQLAAFAVSVGAGCRYCQAHTSHTLEKMPTMPQEKLDQLLLFETSPLYSPRERAVVALALTAAESPNGTRDQHFTALREHFTDRQIVQLVAILGLFGFLNRWNDTLATTLEAAPRTFAEAALGSLNWSVGKHGATV